ncbi:MAG: phosphatidate cytidylyltransferase [Bdellovibrionales bacterium]|nr:phosphatidate cytidylyltransferase [Bdellovibrionales bacterium]
MSSLAWRIVSALVAIALLISSHILFGKWGLFGACTFVIFVAIIEYKNIGFLRIKTPTSFQYMFLAISCALYPLLVLGGVSEVVTLTVGLAFFYALGLWLGRDKLPNVKLLTSLGIGTLGLVYCVAFPALAMKTLIEVPNGALWFTALLVVVPAGDTGAYFGGRFFGNRKLMPSISPKKTIEGAIAGAACSSLFGALYFYYFLPEVAPWAAALACLVTGVVAQCGDLFVSLIKRVAEVKDSGKIMPGHGGFLDRLDGIYIAAPLIYALAKYL